MELYTGSNDLGDPIFTIENNLADYISGKEGEFGLWGYGLFNEIALIGEGVSQTYEITIQNDKDYIVELIAEGMGIENAEYRE